MKNKIGILTFHKAHNYGASLQTMALQKMTKAYVVDYYDNNIYNQYKIIKPLRKNMIKYMIDFILELPYLNKNIVRHKKFENFIKKLPKVDYKNIFDINILITGSDQVWNPEITGGISDVYTLNFCNDNIKRISYAASIGNEKNVQKYKEDYKTKLSRLDRISVREESAKEELQKILPEKKIEVVLDPTLLLTKKEWEEEIKDIKDEKEKYILGYYVKEDEEFEKITNELSKKTGLKVIHFDKRNRGLKNVLRSAYTEGPLEFINLIKKAEYIVATSFHATVFSIIFNKKFWIVPHKTTGSRVTDLLKKFGISNRAVNTIDEFKERDYNEEIDYERVNKKLEEERKKSIKWLMDAIEK